MRYNGYLKYRILPESADVAFDDDGCPVAEVVEWSDPVECFIAINEVAIHHPSPGETDGGYTRRSYELLTERMDLDTDRIQLSQYGRLIGEFNVVNIQQTSMDRTKIVLE